MSHKDSRKHRDGAHKTQSQKGKRVGLEGFNSRQLDILIILVDIIIIVISIIKRLYLITINHEQPKKYTIDTFAHCFLMTFSPLTKKKIMKGKG